MSERPPPRPARRLPPALRRALLAFAVLTAGNLAGVAGALWLLLRG